MRHTRPHALSLTLAALCLGTAGCSSTGVALAAGAAAGAAAVSYVQGDLEADLGAPPPQVAAAVEASFDDLALPIVSDETTEIDGRLEAKTAHGTRVAVDLQSVDPDRTRIVIRVGTFGEERLSRKILARVRAHLAA